MLKEEQHQERHRRLQENVKEVGREVRSVGTGHGTWYKSYHGADAFSRIHQRDCYSPPLSYHLRNQAHLCMACRPNPQIPIHFLASSLESVQFVGISLKKQMCKSAQKIWILSLQQYSINGLLFNVMFLNTYLSRSYLELSNIANVHCYHTKLLLFSAILTVHLSVSQK